MNSLWKTTASLGDLAFDDLSAVTSKRKAVIGTTPVISVAPSSSRSSFPSA